MDVNSKIFVAGHAGLVGSAVVRRLAASPSHRRHRPVTKMLLSMRT